MLDKNTLLIRNPNADQAMQLFSKNKGGFFSVFFPSYFFFFFRLHDPYSFYIGLQLIRYIKVGFFFFQNIYR